MVNSQSDRELLIELKTDIKYLAEAIKDLSRDFAEFKKETEKNFRDQRSETDSLKYFKSKLIGGALAISSVTGLLFRVVHF